MRELMVAAVGLLMFGSAQASAQAQWQWPAMMGPGTHTATEDAKALAEASGHAIYSTGSQARTAAGPLYFYVDSILARDRWFIGDVILNNPTDVDYCYTAIGKVWHIHSARDGTPIDIAFTTKITVIGQPGQQFIKPHSWVVQFRGVDDGGRWFYPNETAAFSLGWKIAYAVWPRDTTVSLAQSCETNRPDEYDEWVRSDVAGMLHNLIR